VGTYVKAIVKEASEKINEMLLADKHSYFWAFFKK
jgi:hypothetical protein